MRIKHEPEIFNFKQLFKVKEFRNTFPELSVSTGC